MEEPYFAPVSPLLAGLKAKCPKCGRGKLFKGFLSVEERCEVCDLNFGFVDAGDGPAIFIILIAGFVIAGGALGVEMAYHPDYWVHALLWGPMIVLLPLILLRPFKAILIALQYTNKAQEGQIEKAE